MLHIKQASFKINDYKTFSITSELTIHPNSAWAFVGRNGSGKSTLVRALAGEQQLLLGEISNQFKRISHISLEQLQKIIEAEWQRNNSDMLAPDEDDSGQTTEEIIQAENEPLNNQLFKQLADQFGITHLLKRRFKYLSTGETRKTLLCRVLMAQPDLLILDEPFDGLDIASRENLAQQLSSLSKQGVAIILVVNRFNDIPPFIDNIGFISDCELIKVGQRNQLLNDDAFKQLIGIESKATIQLPESDEATTILPPDIPRVILNHGYVLYYTGQDNAKPIINDLTWQVNANENWQIVGPNGAGKSTLLSLITGDHPQGYSNDLTLFGRKRGSGETIWDIKRHIGYVSSSLHQDYRVSSTIKNVLLSGYLDSIGIYSTTSDRQHKLVDEWLQLLDLTTEADKPFQSLSWGQQRLLLIVRAMVKHPTLLILDEPLQGLDQLNRELVKRWIDLLIGEGKTQLLFVSHHLEDAPKCITHRLTFEVKNNSYQYRQEKLQ
ncbi:molybdate ABC transporter ATP-binding protein ModF [Orbaceae bacterium ESL0721]|nr:molybdate ABC transporter ATP-binding protein ModF [Orbaceae bacterium ESL0721]